MTIVGSITVQHQLRHDVRLRAAVQERYELAFLPPEHPPFDIAEAKITPSYVEALNAVLETRLAGREMMIEQRQLALI